MDRLAEFRRELERKTDRPERLALSIGSLIDPAFDIELYVRQLDELADQVDQRLPAGAAGRGRAEGFVSVLHREMGFCGNRESYYDPANSFLHRVIETRRGLPITLSLLYMAVADRLGANVSGMGFPGHFMLAVRDRKGQWFLDPFHGKVVEPEELAGHFGRIFGRELAISAPFDRYRVSRNALILRILNNLRAVYVSRHRLKDALAVLDRMVLIQPEEAFLWRDRGLVHFGLKRLLAAENDLRRYFRQRDGVDLLAGAWGTGVVGEMAGSWVAGRGKDARTPSATESEGVPELSEDDRRLLFALNSIRDGIRRRN